MYDEPSFLEREQRALITRRLASFALGWLGALAIWLVVFADEGRLTAGALALAVLEAVALVIALIVCRADPAAARVRPVVLTTSVVLGVLSIAVAAAVGAYGEILAFMLLTLYLASALLFSWGWRAEIVLLGVTLSAWALVAERFVFLVPLPELGAAITIGASLSLAIAEGRARASQRGWRRRRAEEEATRAFEESRNAYRDLAESAQDLIWSTDRDGRLTYVNEATARFVGRPATAILGRSIRDSSTDDPRNPHIDEVMARLAAGEVLPPFLIQTSTPRGSRWIEVVSSAVWNVDGALTGFRGISRDVTQRQAAAERLRASEARYRGLVQSQHELVVRMDLDGRVTFANEAYLGKFGERGPDVIGRTFFHIVHPDDVSVVTAAMGALQRPPHHALIEVRNLTLQGWRWLSWESGVVLDEEGRPIELQSVGRDVTERRAAEEALRASLVELRRSEEKLRLLAQRQVAIREEERKRVGFDLHDDVCQELVGVGILIESLRRKLTPMPVEQAAEFDRVVAYLGEVVEHLRLLAREMRPLLLRDLGLDGSLRSLADGMSSPTLRVLTEFRTRIPALDEETEVTVYRIAQEALGNAVRHAGASRIVVALGAADDTLRLEVRDDGRGFDPAARPAAALGITSMEERAIALGGRLSIQSQRGVGTTVGLTCPLDVRPPLELTGPAVPSPTRSSSRLSAATTPRSAARD